MHDTPGARIAARVDGDEAEVRARRLRAFEQAFVLIVVAEYWLRALPKWGMLGWHYDVLLGVSTVAGVAILAAPWLRRAGFALLAAVHLVLLWTEFPSSGNHAYLELYICLLAILLRRDDPDEALLELRALRWLAVIILFWSGVQKLAHGHWVNGEYLIFSLGSETYRTLLGWTLPADELARIAALSGQVGEGPYRVVGAPPLLGLANATWLAEIALAPALVWRRTRALALPLALLLLAGIEVVAREVFFGLVFASLLLLFAHGDRQSTARWLVAAALVVLALSRLGVLPEVTYY
ncbi:MAG: hypothetical protein FJ148_13210 [Deltaproteobacteria bacterium]|nr:hypothetical protein [Deltaproteobacteria bacterium]